MRVFIFAHLNPLLILQFVIKRSKVAARPYGLTVVCGVLATMPHWFCDRVFIKGVYDITKVIMLLVVPGTVNTYLNDTNP